MKKLKFLLIFVFLFLYGVSADIGDGLISYLSFDIQFNDTFANYDATGFGGASITTSGCLIGNCTHLDGVNDAVIWGNVPMSATSADAEGTIGCWINFDDLAGSVAAKQPLYGRSDGPYGEPFHLNWRNLSPHEYEGFIGSGSPSHTEVSVVNITINTTQWDLYTVYFEETGGTARVVYWINDNLILNDTYSQHIVDDVNNNLLLGARTDVGTGYMDGWLDECFIYNRSLSTAEVSELWNSGDGCNPVDNPTGCAVVEPRNQTPTPTADLLNISQNNESVELNASSGCQDKCLLYQDAANVANISSWPYNRTGLSASTSYDFKFSVYNASYNISESNFSNTVTTTTAANAGDTCTPPASGNWLITDDCTISVDDTIPGNISLKSGGNLTLVANLSFTGSSQYIYIDSGSFIHIHSGGVLQ